MATINVRIDESLKEKANTIFDDLGLGMSSAITIFLKAVVRNNGIPFSLEIPNDNTIKALNEADQIVSGKVKAKRYKSVNDLRKDLDV